MMINYEDGIGQLLKFIFYYGSGVFSPGMFFGNKNIYCSVIKYIKRNPRHFKEVKLNNGTTYYVLSEDYIENKIGLFNVLLYPSPKDYLEIFHALIYLSLCIEKYEFRKYYLVDFLNGANDIFVLDNLEPINDFSSRKTIVTFEPRIYSISTFGLKTIVPKVCEFRSVKKILMGLSNLHQSNTIPKSINATDNSILVPLISKDVDDYFNELTKEKTKKSIKK
jgi:hypothetical protein